MKQTRTSTSHSGNNSIVYNVVFRMT